MAKHFILNADDFGMTKEYNRAVLEGYNNGFLKSASLCANGEGFMAAINDILPECPNLGVGVHLNIIEGKSLTKCKYLTDADGNFNKGYLYFILNQFNKKFINEVEAEFRAQIEKIKEHTEIDHIDSHVHTHAIPNIFKLTVKLAQEYGIPNIRTQFEHPYLVPETRKHTNIAFPINLIKLILLNTFTLINRKVIKNTNLKTNDYILGVSYTGMMDSKTVEYGLKALEDGVLAEALIHPCYYTENIVNSHSTEFLITIDKNLEDKIKRMGYEITNYKQL